MKEDLTILEAYRAMYVFLDNYYFQMGQPDEIGALLSDLRLMPDGIPGDPAAWHDWQEAVKKVVEGRER